MKKRPTNPHEHAVAMGFDAMRISLGIKPKTFSGSEVVEWLCMMLGIEAWK